MQIDNIYEIYDSTERKWLVDNCEAVRAVMHGIQQQAEQNVLAVRGSYDAPGFDACVEAEKKRIETEEPEVFTNARTEMLEGWGEYEAPAPSQQPDPDNSMAARIAWSKEQCKDQPDEKGKIPIIAEKDKGIVGALMCIASLDDEDDICHAKRVARAAVEDYRVTKRESRVDGWQPIETAPKDGSEIWIAHPDYTPTLARWRNDKGGHWFVSSTPGFWPEDDPTHWMPRPERLENTRRGSDE
jgi:hypothetical protein